MKDVWFVFTLTDEAGAKTVALCAQNSFFCSDRTAPLRAERRTHSVGMRCEAAAIREGDPNGGQKRDSRYVLPECEKKTPKAFAFGVSCCKGHVDNAIQSGLLLLRTVIQQHLPQTLGGKAQGLALALEEIDAALDDF